MNYGDLTEGFLCYEFGGAYFRNFTVIFSHILSMIMKHTLFSLMYCLAFTTDLYPPVYFQRWTVNKKTHTLTK